MALRLAKLYLPRWLAGNREWLLVAHQRERLLLAASKFPLHLISGRGREGRREGGREGEGCIEELSV